MYIALHSSASTHFVSDFLIIRPWYIHADYASTYTKYWPDEALIEGLAISSSYARIITTYMYLSSSIAERVVTP